MSDGDGRPPGPRSRNEPDESLLTRSRTALTRFRTAEDGPLMFVREVLTSVAAVALIGLVLFAVSGVWPPMVAVESPSMDPHMQKGDLVFVTEPGRYMPEYTQGQTGVVTYAVGADRDYRTFDDYGSVVIYDNPRRAGPPIVHRAMFWVDAGENWYDRADPEYLRGDSCEEVPNCPAPHAGFVTKGDNNAYYDQASDISTVVKPDWLVGVARLRIPYLGWVRLGLSNVLVGGPAPATVDVEQIADSGQVAGPGRMPGPGQIAFQEPVGVAAGESADATESDVVTRAAEPLGPHGVRRPPSATSESSPGASRPPSPIGSGGLVAA